MTLSEFLFLVTWALAIGLGLGAGGSLSGITVYLLFHRKGLL